MSVLGNTQLFSAQLPASGVAGRSFEAFTFPVGVLVAALTLAKFPPRLPELAPVLEFYGAYLALGLALVVAAAFQRGRALLAVLALLAAYAALRAFLGNGPGSLAPRAVYGAACVLLPLNLAAFAMLPERGVLNAFGARRLGLLLLECAAVAAIVLGSYRAIADNLDRPGLSLAVTAAALLAALACAAGRAAAIEAALATSIVAVAAACQSAGTAAMHFWFAVAGFIVAAGVVHDSYRMAFHDALTGLPGRRALNERLMSLEGDYAIAMLDIDHFKGFNDTWGHEAGDQVLKLVASRLQRIGGGGRAYRYGGEEFAIVFPGLRLPAACFHAETLRKSIERYHMRIRARASDRRGGRADESVSRLAAVTVSIGVAEHNARRTAPEAVCAAADAALYRAKAAGRNRVSR